jgi:hypothetical protein
MTEEDHELTDEEKDIVKEMVRRYNAAGAIGKFIWTVLLTISGILVALSVIFDKFRFWEHVK